VLKSITDPERQVSFCKEIIARGLSVKEASELVKEPPPAEAPEDPADTRGETGNGHRGGGPAPEKTNHVLGLEDELRQRLGTRVEIKLRSKDRGQIVLGFESNDDFERLLEVLRK
jgi:ParB family chromosome partitioning protein